MIPKVSLNPLFKAMLYSVSSVRKRGNSVWMCWTISELDKQVSMALNVHRNHMAYQGRGEGGGGRERVREMPYISLHCRHQDDGAGIVQWLEHRTRDWKVAGSNPCWNGGRIFFSRVDFLCWLLFRYPFHPRVTTVARKKSRSFCQKCRWQVTAKHAYTLRMWILLNRASASVTTCP